MSDEMRKLIRLVESAAELEEMPIANYTTIGDFEKPTKGFKTPVDRKLVTNPKAVANLHKKFANNNFDFNLIMVNMPEAGKHAETGEVDQDWLMKNMPKSFPQMAINDNAINVIYVGNTGAERYMFTPWIIAHRLGHALRRSRGELLQYINRELEQTAKRILKQYQFDPENSSRGGYGRGYGGDYDQQRYKRRRTAELGMRHFYEQIGTFKSARDKNLREPFEFVYECLAQYLTVGKIRFNHLDRCIQTGTGGWGSKEQACLKYSEDKSDMEYELDGINEQIDELAEQISSEFETILGRSIGRIFVM